MTAFPLTEELEALLAIPAVAEWLLANIEHGAAPAFSEEGQLCFRFEDDAEAERFQERWLS